MDFQLEGSLSLRLEVLHMSEYPLLIERPSEAAIEQRQTGRSADCDLSPLLWTITPYKAADKAALLVLMATLMVAYKHIDGGESRLTSEYQHK